MFQSEYEMPSTGLCDGIPFLQLGALILEVAEPFEHGAHI